MLIVEIILCLIDWLIDWLISIILKQQENIEIIVQ